uniref:non-specific serine/threonine protein kinase n=1 Tax=Parastrongyloides trichosuri TaxID=131310 RepID=A0A0N4ZVM0_PARTI
MNENVLYYLTLGCFGRNTSFKINDKNYRTIKLLATGGFGQVFLVENDSSKYAIKHMESNSLYEVNRIKKEIELHKSCDHPNILKVLDYKIDVTIAGDAGTFLMLMPYIKSGTLQDEYDIINKSEHKQLIDANRIKKIFHGALKAVSYLHNRDPIIIHRDLKPANLLLDKDDNVLLMDFGSATEGIEKIVDSRHSRKMIDEANELCSMPYRACELFSCETGTELSGKIDVYSLGCILYSLYHFRAPYDLEYQKGGSYALGSNSGIIRFDEKIQINEDVKKLVKNMMAVNYVERPTVLEAINIFEKITF